jgi:hypothetical protein
MKILILLICSVTVLAIFNSCATPKPESYSFFIAGHTYGKPFVENDGFHPPFKAKIPYIKSRTEIEFGVLLGDIVWLPSEKDWDEVDSDIAELGIPIYIAAGNHEMKDSALFVKRYGETYFSFKKHGDLFIVLNPNLDHWNISGAQLEFLKKTLIENAAASDNIFVFLHQVLWWDEDNKYGNMKLNSLEDRDENLNFWTEIEPLFHKLENKVVFCAGDIGANSTAIDYMFDQYDNITFIASGMGEGNGDNFVIINVDEKKDISFEKIELK